MAENLKKKFLTRKNCLNMTENQRKKYCFKYG